MGLHRGATRPGGTGEIACDLSMAECEGPLKRVTEDVHAVLHGAACVRLWGPPEDLVQANCAMTRRVVKACEQSGKPKLVFLSSASVAFRRGDQLRIGADTPLPPRSLCAYAASKAACEDIVRGYSGPWSILRPQAVMGTGDRHLLPPILKAARGKKWAWIGRRNGVRADLLSIQNLVHCCAASLQDASQRGTWYLSDGAPEPLEPLLREVLQRAGLPVGERRVPAPVARVFSSTVEGLYRGLFPAKEPPLHRFGIETISRTRIIDPAPMLERFGPLPITFREGFEQVLEGLGNAA